MHRLKLVWVCVRLSLVLGELFGTTDPFIALENVAGKLVFYQNRGNATYERDTVQLASDVSTVAMFEIADPDNTLRTTKFTYTWDLGNGEIIKGTEPVVRYNYSESGNYTVRLRVGAKSLNSTPIFGMYSMDVKVLDAIKNIELEGPSNLQVTKNTRLSFRMDGSPPMWVCWRILPDCTLSTPVGCTLNMLYADKMHVDHTFTSTGMHCLEISACNNISKLQTSYSLYVRRNPYSTLLFTLPCLAILMATFSFITVTACRPRHQNKPQIAAPSNTIFLEESEAAGNFYFSFSSAEQGENHPLLQKHMTHYSFE